MIQRGGFYDVVDYLDSSLKILFENLNSEIVKNIEEIRLRVGKPVMIHASKRDYYIDSTGIISDKLLGINQCYITTKENIYITFEKLSNYSVYSIQEEINNGFLTIKGGHRVGLVGKAIYDQGKLQSMKDISSINIRISKEIIGASDNIVKYVIKDRKTIYNTLIVSPPKCGKTTILRDLIRNISNGIARYNFDGLKVGVVDERSELAGMYNGQPQNDLGYRTDVLDGFYKSDGMTMLLRSMSPDVIATDELGHPHDIDAIYEAMKSGVKIISTAHGVDLEDIKKKSTLNKIIKEGIFEKIIILDNTNGVGTISKVIDSNFGGM